MFSNKKRSRYKRPGGCRRILGCFTFLFFIILLLVGCLLMAVATRSASALTRQPHDVLLIIDNSNSMFEKGGVGSDPTFLRLDAARLFLSYLGVDEPDVTHRAGVIFFGSEAETAVSLTPLTNDEQRIRLYFQIANPPRMGWTNHLAALQLADAQLQQTVGDAQPAIILLTDGRSEWAERPTAQQQAAILAALREQGSEFAAQGIPLFIILLANEATQNDAEIATIWQPLWQEMSDATPPGRFFIAQSATELPAIYHDIVVALTQRETAGVVVETAVTSTESSTIDIPENLDQMTLVISKSSPTQTISIQAADGSLLNDNNSTIRHADGGTDATEEVWVIEQPGPGTWTIRIDGAGDVTIWQDYVPAPVQPPVVESSLPPASPTPVNVEPSPIPTVAATRQPTPVQMAVRQTPYPAVITKPPVEMVEASAKRPIGFLTALLLVVAFGSVGGGVWFVRRRGRKPIVTGTLRLLDGVRFANGHPSVQLDTLARPMVIIGKPPADVPLKSAAERAVIRPGTVVANTQEMLISGSDALHMDGMPVQRESKLVDTAVLDLGGGVRLRYENLMLRRAARERRNF